MIRRFRSPMRWMATAIAVLTGCDGGCHGTGTDPDPNNQSPTVTFSAPAEGAQVALYSPITFTATATDPEDGALLVHWSTPALAFTTPFQLGTGPSFSIDTAQAGRLTITAWVQDINGGRDSVSHNVYVGFGGEIAFDDRESILWSSDARVRKLGINGGKPAWSPNGLQIAFVKSDGNDREIYVMNADGTGVPVQVTNNSADDDTPAWAPDGLRLAYDSDSLGATNREIFIKVLATGATTRVTNNPADDSEPAWCGTDIIFQSDRDNDYDIYKQGNLLSAPPVPITSNTVDDLDPHWSVDCTVIIFSHEEANGNLDVYTMNPNGTGALNLTNNPANDRQPDLSPSKLLAVFKSDRGGSEHLWFIKTLGPPQPRVWALPEPGLGHPRWKP